MNQITIVSACEVDGEGFRQRLQGRGVRDCILVLSSEGISLGLLHKELSSRTFVEDEILGREAALDIDSGRIGEAKIIEYGIGKSGGGRFPSNVILQHTGGCAFLGTKSIKGKNAVVENQKFRETPRVYGLGIGAPNKEKNVGQADENGMEKINEFRCTPLCPVAHIDESEFAYSEYASRFFKQVTSREELHSYFDSMVRR